MRTTFTVNLDTASYDYTDTEVTTQANASIREILSIACELNDITLADVLSFRITGHTWEPELNWTEAPELPHFNPNRAGE